MAAMWTKVITEDDDAHIEHLIVDGDSVVGYVERFFDNGPTYAWAKRNLLGAFTTTEAAKLAVENSIRLH